MIQLIDNRDGRLEELRPLFSKIASNRQGKLSKEFFIVKTSLTVNRPISKAEMAFKMIQEHSNQRGFLINCYCL